MNLRLVLVYSHFQYHFFIEIFIYHEKRSSFKHTIFLGKKINLTFLSNDIYFDDIWHYNALNESAELILF